MDDIDPARPEQEPDADRDTPWPRILGAFGVALAFALAVYLLLESMRFNGTISFTFLLLLPACLSAFVCYVSDPWAKRSLGQYMAVPFWLLLVVIVCSIFILREGTICVVLLSPLWLISGVIGAGITHKARRRTDENRGGRVQASAILVLPLIAM